MNPSKFILLSVLLLSIALFCHAWSGNVYKSKRMRPVRRPWRSNKVNKAPKFKSPSRLPRPSYKSAAKSESNEFQPRIVGGWPANYGDIPSQVNIWGLDEFRCGGTLIDVDGLIFVLTAAHCVWIGDPHPLSVISHTVLRVGGGDTNILYEGPRDQFFNVSEIVIHEHYDPRWDLNDLAILFLSRYVFEGMGMHSVALPGRGWDEPPIVQISGWGAQVFQGKPTFDLQYVVIPTLPWQKCRLLKNANRGHNITRANICVSPVGIGQIGTCHGDSGGPALGYNKTHDLWHLVGVASFVIADICGDPRNAAGYVRVSYYVDWIKKKARSYKIRYGTGNPFNNDTIIHLTSEELGHK